MNKIKTIIRSLLNSGLTDIGDVYLFGSFIKSRATNYNDIDIYIDAEPTEETLRVIQGVLKKVPFKLGKLGPQYYRPNPIPPPKPPFPFPAKPGNNDELHVTVCPIDKAKSQAFFSTLISGHHVKLDKCFKDEAA
jgi:hypothetical protein